MKWRDAAHLANPLETARCEIWCRRHASQFRTLRSVYERLVELADPPKYLADSVFCNLQADSQAVADGFAAGWPEALSDAPEIRMLQDILKFLEAPFDVKARANETFISNELVRSRKFFDQVEDHPLTEEQRKAIIIDEDRNLVVAAAGSGKTSVIAAKTGWLIRKEYRKPSELLLLAFARNARDEMKKRIDKCLGTTIARDVTVHTFHSLGSSVIGDAEGRKPTVAKVADDSLKLHKLLEKIVADLFADREFSATLLKWFSDEFASYKSTHNFSNWNEYYNYIRTFDIVSLKGDKVHSFEECKIANFLYLKRVDYQYEAPYEHDLSTSKKRVYKPDFYLPEYKIYIEHFGINALGNTAPYVDQEQYRQDMEWKRGVHVEYGTVLIETFSYEEGERKLLPNLAKKLTDYGVVLSSTPPEDVFDMLNQQGRINRFAELVGTFLRHYKGYSNPLPSFANIADRAGNPRDRTRAQAFLSVFQPIFERYQDALIASGEVDFHDMINQATDLIETRRYHSPFGYILVDEFQDISPSRVRLLKALLNSSPGSQLFAIGDDWQAIYRFTGSDIAVIRQFGDHFGMFERIDLATTFRCADRIVTVATDFILRNPAQIHKTVRAKRKSDRPAVYVGLPSEQETSLLKEALDRVAEDARRHDGLSEVLSLPTGWLEWIPRPKEGMTSWRTVALAVGFPDRRPWKAVVWWAQPGDWTTPDPYPHERIDLEHRRDAAGCNWPPPEMSGGSRY